MFLFRNGTLVGIKQWDGQHAQSSADGCGRNFPSQYRQSMGNGKLYRIPVKQPGLDYGIDIVRICLWPVMPAKDGCKIFSSDVNH